MVKRVVIAGSRNFTDYKLFSSIVDKYLSRIKNEYELIILSGHCVGTDLMAEKYARENRFALEIYPAEWDKYGRSAGPKRNKEMVEKADFAIAFSSGSAGTESLIEFAVQKGIPTRIYKL